MEDKTQKIPSSAPVPLPTIQRLPTYLNYLSNLYASGQRYVSSALIAKALGLTGIQVRKDLAWISQSGKPRTGFPLHSLIEDIRHFLGYEVNKRTVLIGCGHLGLALLHYEGFRDYGIDIVGAFDVSQDRVGRKYNHLEILHMDRFQELFPELDAQIAIVTVPASCCQAVCDQLVAAGVKAIWNFAPQVLHVPADVVVEQVDLARSLAILWNQLQGA